MNIKFKANKDFCWRFDKVAVGTIKKDTILTVIDKKDNKVLLSNRIGWVGNNSKIWKWLDLI